MMPGGSGIDMEQVKLAVIHYLQDMAVSAHEKLYGILAQKRRHAAAVSAGISPDMCKQHIHILHAEHKKLRALASYYPAIDIAFHSPYNGAHSLKPLHNIYVTYIACMPYLVAIGKMQRETVVPAGMRIGKYPYAFHQKFCKIIISRGAKVIVSSIVTSSPVIMLWRRVP